MSAATTAIGGKHLFGSQHGIIIILYRMPVNVRVVVIHGYGSA